MARLIFAAGLLAAVATVSGCSANETTVIVPQPAAVAPGIGCVDGFGAIQSGTEICVGASG